MSEDTGAPPPPRPDPWATTAPREALRDNNAARIVSMTPGMTQGPGGAYLPNMVDFCGYDENYVPDVRFTGQKAMVLRSATQHVHNGGSGGICEPIGHAAQVRAGGSPVIRHGDMFWMDNRKTVGEATFVRDTASYAAPPDDDPFPGSMRLVRSSSGDPPQVMSDASPDPSYSRPGAQLALNDTTGQFTTPATPSTTAPPALERTGPFGQPLGGPMGRILPYIGLAPGAMEGFGQAYQLGNALREQDAGPNDVVGNGIANTLESQVAPGTPQFPAVAASRGMLPYMGTEVAPENWTGC